MYATGVSCVVRPVAKRLAWLGSPAWYARFLAQVGHRPHATKAPPHPRESWHDAASGLIDAFVRRWPVPVTRG